MHSEDAIVYVLDDEPAMLKALSRLLRVEGFQPRAFTTMEDFLAARREGETACLILDVGMPGLDGMEVQARLQRDGVMIPIIFLTGRGSIPLSVRAMRSGAVDFLTKPVNDTDLLRAVRAALDVAGEQHRRRIEHQNLLARHASLTPREREVMQYVVAGKLNKQIAADLGTGEQNIKIHRARVMRKMGVASVPDLVRAAGSISAHAG
jgi:FixJ family two-component response regulator